MPLLLAGQGPLSLTERAFRTPQKLLRRNNLAVLHDRKRCQTQVDSDLGVDFGQRLLVDLNDRVAAAHGRDDIDVGFEAQQFRECLPQDSNILGE
ncbi:hypothetical protein [Rhodococcus artemisiae]|uniref:Uncharacterized protein n=1 Tax=Rhodococcus artemisiae TaxID=714159 RepID=A0ABU7L4U6_9NOCA|nr:hypothetical protein [Rhodococcus artemisiae]MEE2055932.1 hypothetical protein [Rhodococcus artemisiae]